MQNTRFLSRELASKYTPKPGAVLIAIHDISESPLKAYPAWRDALHLRFHDTDGSAMGLEVFAPHQAQSVLGFVARHSACSELVVHCSAGRSRSAAVALFLAEEAKVPCLKVNQPVTRQSWPYYNRRVYEVLRLVARRGAA